MAILSLIPAHLGALKTISPIIKQETGFPFGLGQAGVHECVESQFGDMGALTGFVLANVKPKGLILWVRQYKMTQEHGTLLSSGSADFQHTKQLFLHVNTSKKMDVLWAIEEGIKSSAVSLVIGEVEDADFTATRRLKLASERFGVPVVLLMPHTREGISACDVRWRIQAQPSSLNPYDSRAPGLPHWKAVLERCRVAPERAGEAFDLEYDDEALSVRVVSALGTGSVAPQKVSRITRETDKVRQTA